MKIRTILGSLIILGLAAVLLLEFFPLENQKEETRKAREEEMRKEEMIKAREKEEINKANNQCVKAFEQDFPEYKNFGCWYKVNFSICLCQTWEVKNAWERAHTIYDGERDVKEIRFNLKPLTPSN